MPHQTTQRRHAPHVVSFAVIGLLACVPVIPYVTESLVQPLNPHWASTEGNVLKQVTTHGIPWAWYDLICDGEREARVRVGKEGVISVYLDVSARYSVGEACYPEAVNAAH